MKRFASFYVLAILLFVGSVSRTVAEDLASLVDVDPVPDLFWPGSEVTALDAEGLTIALGQAGRDTVFESGDINAEREARFVETMTRTGVDAGLALLTGDALGLVQTSASGLITYLNYEASEPPAVLEDTGGLEVLTLAGPNFLPGLGEYDAAGIESDAFLPSFSFDYDPLAVQLATLRYEGGLPTVYEPDGFRLGAAVAIDNQDRIVVAAPDTRFNFWFPPKLAGASGFTQALTGNVNAPPIPTDLYGAYDTTELQAMVGQAPFEPGVSVDETVRSLQTETSAAVAEEEGVDLSRVLADSATALGSLDAVASNSERIAALLALGESRRLDGSAPRRNLGSSRVDRLGQTFSRVRQSAVFEKAGRVVGPFEKALFFGSLFQFAFQIVDEADGGEQREPYRAFGSPFPTGLLDTLVPVSGLEWASSDPFLHWQRAERADWRGSPGDTTPAQRWRALYAEAYGHPMGVFDPSKAGHRRHSGYSLDAEGGRMVSVSIFENRAGYGVLDAYRHNEAGGGWLPLAAGGEETMEGVAELRHRVLQADKLAPHTRSLDWEETVPRPDFRGTARQTVILGDDVFVLREEGGLLWFPDRLHPDRHETLPENFLAGNMFYEGLAQVEGYYPEISNDALLDAPGPSDGREEVFAGGRRPIALAYWDGALGGSVAAAPPDGWGGAGLALGIPGARDGEGALLVLRKARLIHDADRPGADSPLAGRRMAGAPDGDGILLPPRLSPGTASWNRTGSDGDGGYYAAELLEVPESMAPADGLGRTVAFSGRYLAASDNHGRVHLWLWDEESFDFRYVEAVGPAHAEAARVAVQAEHLRFAGQTLVGVDRLNDGAQVVWASRITGGGALEVLVDGEGDLFPSGGVPVSVGRATERLAGRSALAYEGEAGPPAVTGRILVPDATLGGSIGFSLRLTAFDETGAMNAHTFNGDGKLLLGTTIGDEVVELGEARRISSSWTRPSDFTFRHQSEWTFALPPGLNLAGRPLHLRYEPGNGDDGDNPDILALAVDDRGGAGESVFRASFLCAVEGGTLRATRPGERLRFRLPPGDYRIFTRPAYEAEGDRRATVRLGETSSARLELLGFRGEIGGRLVDAHGLPLHGIGVELRRDGSTLGAAASDALGRFVLENASPDAAGQTVEASLPSGLHLDPPPGEVGAGPLELTVASDWQLEGRVAYDADGELSGIEGRTVRLRRTDQLGSGSGEREWTTETDAEGNYRFESLFPGRYEVSVPRGERYDERLRRSLSVTSSEPSPVDFNLDAFASRFSLSHAQTGAAARPGIGAVELRQYLPTGGVPALAAPTLGEEGDALHAANLEAEGVWVASLDPREWYVLDGPEAPWPLVGDDLPAGSFVVTEDETAVEVLPVREVSGRLELPNEFEAPAEGIRLLLSGSPAGSPADAGPRHFPGRTDAAGAFTVFAPEGNYTLRVEGGFHFETSAPALDLSADADLGALAVRPEPFSIGGVLFPPAPGSEVHLEWEGGSRRLAMDPLGNFDSGILDARRDYRLRIVAGEGFTFGPIGGVHTLTETEDGREAVTRDVSVKVDRNLGLFQVEGVDGLRRAPIDRWYLQSHDEDAWQGNEAWDDASFLPLSRSEYEEIWRRKNYFGRPELNWSLADRESRVAIHPVETPGLEADPIPESLPAGSRVAELADASGNWRIVDFWNDGSLPFAPTADGRGLETTRELDFEGGDGSFSFLLNLGLDGVEQFRVTETAELRVIDVNDPFRIILEIPGDGGSLGVPENLPVGGLAATLEALDPDSDTFVFEILETDAPVEIIGGNELRTTAPLDHEDRSSYRLRLAVEDEAGHRLEQEHILNIADVNEAPSGVLGQPDPVADGAADFVDVPLRDLDDGDHGGQSIAFSLETSGDDLIRDWEVSPDPDDPAVRILRLHLRKGRSGEVSAALRLTDDGGTRFGGSNETVLSTTVTVEPTLPTVATEPLPADILFERPLLLRAGFVGGTRPIEYQWEKDGAPLPGATSPRLFIGETTADAAGNYRLVATNAAGSVATRAANVRVRLPADLAVWGPDVFAPHDPVAVRTPLRGVLEAVSTRDGVGLALRADGSLVTFRVFDSQTEPAYWSSQGNLNQRVARERVRLLESVPGDASPAQAVAAGSGHFLVVREDGSVRAWGGNGSGEATVPPDLPLAVGVAAAEAVSAAVLADGSAVFWGDGVPTDRSLDPSFRDLVSLSIDNTDGLKALGLRRDGSVASWPTGAPVPTGLPPLVQVLRTWNAAYGIDAAGVLHRWDERDPDSLEPLPALPALRSLRDHGGRLLAEGRDGSLTSWMEFDPFDEDGWVAGASWLPPGETLQTPLSAGIDYRQAGLLAPTAPRIDRAPQAEPVGLGESLVLSVGTFDTGLPLQYQWSRDGVDLPGEAGPRLVLEDVDPVDEGEYRVTVSNAIGETESGPVTVEVVEPPVWSELPADLTVVDGDSFSLGGTATGEGSLRYQWFRNGSVLPGETGPTLQGTASPALAGTYRLRVSNLGGAVEADAVLEVNTPVSVQLPDDHLTVVPGARLVLDAGFGGDPAPSFSWSFNGATIDGATGSRLDLGHFEPGEAGTYMVTATNEAGESSAEIEITGGSAGRIAAWGADPFGQSSLPDALAEREDWVALASGSTHHLALDSSGGVSGWGSNDAGQLDVPAFDSPVAAIAAGRDFSLALLRNGAVKSWGAAHGEPPVDLPPAVAIAAGETHALALLEDGTVRAWGFGPGSSVPADAGGLVAIAANRGAGFAVDRTGRVHEWGAAPRQEPTSAYGLPGDPVARVVAGGDDFALITRSGRLVEGPDWLDADPARDLVALAFGDGFALLEYRDGTVVSERAPTSPVPPMPSNLPAPHTVSAGGLSAAVLVAPDSAPFVDRQPRDQVAAPGTTVRFGLRARGADEVAVQWYRNGSPIAGATQPVLAIADAAAADEGDYHAEVVLGDATVQTAAARLNVTEALDQTPQFLGRYPAEGFAAGIDHDGDLLLLAADTGLEYIDISDPRNPARIDDLRFPAPSGSSYWEVSAAGIPWETGDRLNNDQVAVVLDQTHAGIARLERFRYPDSLVNLDDYRSDSSAMDLVAPVTSIAGGYDILYAATPEGLSALRARVTGDWEREWHETAFYRVNSDAAARTRLVRDGDRLYFAAADRGLFVFDIADPETLRLVGAYPRSGRISAMAAAGDRLYAFSERGLLVLDVENPAAIKVVQAVAAPGMRAALFHDGHVYGAADSGSGVSGNVLVYNVADPEIAYLAASFGSYEAVNPDNGMPQTQVFSAQDLAFADGLLYIAAGGKGVLMLEPIGAPRFESKPGPVVAETGETITLDPGLIATGPVQLSWLRDGAPVDGAEGPELTLEDFDASMAGIYELVATNAQGTTRSAPIPVGIPDASANLEFADPGFAPIETVALGDRVVARNEAGQLRAYSLDGSGLPVAADTYSPAEPVRDLHGHDGLLYSVRGAPGQAFHVDEISVEGGSFNIVRSFELASFTLPWAPAEASLTLSPSGGKLAVKFDFEADVLDLTGTSIERLPDSLPGLHPQLWYDEDTIVMLGTSGELLVHDATGPELTSLGGSGYTSLFEAGGRYAAAVGPERIDLYYLDPSNVFASEKVGGVSLEPGENPIRVRPDPSNADRLLAFLEGGGERMIDIADPRNPELLGTGIDVALDVVSLPDANGPFHAAGDLGLAYAAPGGGGVPAPAIEEIALSGTPLFGQSVTLSPIVTASGPVHYAWSRNGEPVSGGTGPDLTLDNLSFADEGEYRLVASGLGGTDEAVYGTLSIGWDNAPDGDFVVDEQAEFSSDLGLSNAVFEWIEGPATASLSPEGVLSWTPGEDEGGSDQTLRFRVSVDGHSIERSVTLRAAETNTPPTSGRGPVPTAREHALWSYDLKVVDPDVPAQPLVYSILEGPEGMEVDDSGVLRWRPPEFEVLPNPAVVVEVSDGLETIEVSFDVAVVETNRAPEWVVPETALPAAQGEPFGYQLEAVDADLPAQDLSYRLVSGPEGMAVSADGAVSWTPDAGLGQGGLEEALFEVSDGEAAAQAVFSFLVAFDARSYDGWAETFFEPVGDLPVRELERTALGREALPPAGDADRDGIPNLLEFAQGLEPLEAGGETEVRDVPKVDETGAYAFFSRRADRQAAGLRYRPQFSHDLVTWFDATATPEVIAVEGDFERVRVAYPETLPSGEDARFFRLVVDEVEP
ncbi:MAG: carboxypeptidase regulatory-like domain-containing protein [Puniceicoccaceae bacterium]